MGNKMKGSRDLLLHSLEFSLADGMFWDYHDYENDDEDDDDDHDYDDHDEDDDYQDNREEDDGMYTCTVANAHGSISHTIKVTNII